MLMCLIVSAVIIFSERSIRKVLFNRDEGFGSGEPQLEYGVRKRLAVMGPRRLAGLIGCQRLQVVIA